MTKHDAESVCTYQEYCRHTLRLKLDVEIIWSSGKILHCTALRVLPLCVLHSGGVDSLHHPILLPLQHF